MYPWTKLCRERVRDMPSPLTVTRQLWPRSLAGVGEAPNVAWAIDFQYELWVCLGSHQELLPGRSLDVGVERIGPEHAGE